MFADAIEKVGGFTRPLYTITRKYTNTNVFPGIATLFFVNDEGYAVTCKHVARLFGQADEINKKYDQFTTETKDVSSFRKKAIETRFGYNPEMIVQMKNNLIDCVSPIKSVTCFFHETCDLAVIKLDGYTNRHYSGHAVFVKNGEAVRPGDFLCRLGYPFAEYSNYAYNPEKDTIEWTNTGKAGSPRFPIEGMFTRHVAGKDGTIEGIELSTPGLPGQSGGPLFNADGIICGMQSATYTYNLGLNVPALPVSKNNPVKPPTYFHMGRCIHVNIIKEFLREKKIRFYEEE